MSSPICERLKLGMSGLSAVVDGPIGFFCIDTFGSNKHKLLFSVLVKVQNKERLR